MSSWWTRATRVPLPDAVVAFDDDRHLVVETLDAGTSDGEAHFSGQCEAEVLVLRVAIEPRRARLEYVRRRIRPAGTPQRLPSSSSAVFGCAPARLNWPRSPGLRHAVAS